MPTPRQRSRRYSGYYKEGIAWVYSKPASRNHADGNSAFDSRLVRAWPQERRFLLGGCFGRERNSIVFRQFCLLRPRKISTFRCPAHAPGASIHHGRKESAGSLWERRSPNSHYQPQTRRVESAMNSTRRIRRASLRTPGILAFQALLALAP